MSEQNRTEFEWTAPKELAAQLLAEDELTDVEIAQKIDIGRTTLHTWKKTPEFANRVAELVKEFGDIALRRAVARRSRRIAWLDDRIARMRQVILERSFAREMEAAPGGTTGMLVRTRRSIGSGENSEIVEEFEFDAALVKELREHEKQAAIELGQWSAESQSRGVHVNVVNVNNTTERIDQAFSRLVASLPAAERDLLENGGEQPVDTGERDTSAQGLGSANGTGNGTGG